MKLISWNVNHRKQADRQAAAISRRAPDVVALQEVDRSNAGQWQTYLSDQGLRFATNSFGDQCDGWPERARRYGELVASSWPLTLLPIEKFGMPWPERLLSVLIDMPGCPFELHTAYIPPGSSHGWIKIETLEAIYRCLSRNCDKARILCGDFNTPQEERADGRVVTWGESINRNGIVRLLLRGDREGRWDKAEREVLLGLGDFDLGDVFRRIHGYTVQDFSWHFARTGKIIRRRFDHIFASRSLNAIECSYLHGLREEGLSDHSPIECVFQPNALGTLDKTIDTAVDTV
jgi:exonuclease III